MKKSLIHVAIATHSTKESKEIVDWLVSQGVIKDKCINGTLSDWESGQVQCYWINSANTIRCYDLSRVEKFKEDGFAQFRIFKSLLSAKAWYNRPIIEFKPEYDAKLRELGVRTEFIKEFLKSKTKCGCMHCRRDVNSRLEDLNSKENFNDFVWGAFSPELTVNGLDFWDNIIEGYNPITEVRLQESEVTNE